MTTGKNMALTRQDFVSKVMPLLCNMLSRLVIAFLPGSKHLLISWLQSPSAVILEHKKMIPNVQGQRRNLSKMVGRVKSHLKSNLIPARDSWRTQKNLVCTRWHCRDWIKLAFECLSASCGGTGQQWPASSARALGGRPGCGISPLGGTRDQIADIHLIMEKAREFQKNIYFCFSDYAKAFDCVDHNKLWKILKEMGIPDHLTCLLRNLYASQEATVRTRHGTTDWFQIGKGVHQGCILSPCLFNF